MPIFSFSVWIKAGCVLAIAGIAAVKAPIVAPLLLRQAAPAVAVYQRSLPERLATTEDKVEALERRMDNFEHDRIGERMAKLEEQMSILLMLGIPVAIYMTTHTIDTVRRRSRTNKREAEFAEELIERVTKAMETRREQGLGIGAGG